MAPVPHRSRDEYFAAHSRVSDFDDFQAYQPAIYQDGVTFVHVMCETGIVDVDPAHPVVAGAADSLPICEFKEFIFHQFEGFGYIASAYFRPFHIHHDRDMSTDLIANFAHALYDLTRPVVIGVCHIDPANINASFDHFLQGCFVLSGGADREDYFSFMSFLMHVKFSVTELDVSRCDAAFWVNNVYTKEFLQAGKFITY